MNSNGAVFDCTITNRNTTMDTKALRQKILDLAIHGKLVPQDPNDEPAAVLLERIKAEKERLIKEGKIKRSKKSAKTSDTPHYEQVLPKGWCLATLGEVFTLQAGKSITAKDIKDIATELHPYKCYGGNGIRGFVASYNREGDFPIIGRQGALCGNINIAKGKFYATEHAVVVESYCDVDLMWAYYILTALNLNQYATATAQPGLSVAVINDVYIPIPPRKEQERISKTIERWFALIDQIEQGKSDLQTIIKRTKSKILDLAIHGKLVPQDPNDEPAIELLKRINPDFTPCDNGQYGKRPFEIPNSWCWNRLGDINNIARGGSPRPIKDYLTDDENGINWIKIGDTTKEGKYIDSVKEKIRPEGMKKSRFVHKGDFLLTNSMSFGRPYILNVDGCIHDGWLVLSPIGEVYTSDFLYHLLSSSFAFEQFTNVASGGVVTNLNSDKVADTIFPVPPLAEQQRIVAKIEKLFEQLDYIENSLEA